FHSRLPAHTQIRWLASRRRRAIGAYATRRNPMTTDPQPTDETTEIAEAVEPVETPADKPKRSLRSLTSKPMVLVAGAAVIGILVGGGAGFGIGKIGDSAATTSSTASLKLPSTLSGGYKRNATV